MVQLDFAKADGLVTAVAQDWKTGEVLMVAYMNAESWE
ncbi:MAG TPA: phosphoribosyl-AMP cyclohydrolase, partial [Spirochaetia bacterium]|nr:phosphoribosyl-AMP cyclohydrolase [Spirochaetia bacterium]